MNTWLESIVISPQALAYLGIDLIIALALFVTVRALSGFWAKVNTKDELAEKDNFAFGISMAGTVAALGIVLTGAITGESATSLGMEAIGMTAYGVTGLILIKLGRLFHDKIALNEFNKVEQISQQNISIAIVDAASMIATALVIRAVLLWVHGLDLYTLIAALSGFVIAQISLTLITRLREYFYARNNQNASLQQALVQGQVALALRLSGHMISAGLAVTAASNFLVYEPTAFVSNLLGWVIASAGMIIVVSILTTIGRKLVLWGIDTVAEVDHQHNIGVAAIQMAVTIAMSLMLTSLMA